MTMSNYFKRIRSKVGTDLLQVPTAGVLVFDERGRLLLVKNADDQRWGIPGGLIEPMETPSDAAIREVWEETGLKVELDCIAGVFGGPECVTKYPQGDQISWVATIFFAHVAGGEFRPDQVETLDVAFIAIEDLDGYACRPHVRQFLDAVRGQSGRTWYPPPTR